MTDRLNPEALDQQALEAGNAAAKDELWGRLNGGYISDEEVERAATAAVSAYLAALPAPRTITTVEGMGAMPTSAYVEDMHGDRGVVFNEHIWYPETKPIKLGYALKHYGPFTVLWVPTEGGGE